jgi:cysteinyl-tRNA synthetase
VRVTLRLHDTAIRGVREFQPLNPPRVTLYLCGATVQGPPHIGHVRSAVCFDILIRWLEASGYQAVYCRNVTDIDDKIIRVALEQRVPWWQVAERNLRLFRAAYDVLGCRPPDAEPRATGHIPQMVRLIDRLIAAGHAYAAGGDVYFAVDTDPGYGSLSGRWAPDSREDGRGDGLSPRKRNPQDFALWKAAKPGEPSWSTPWGPGRPGWHLECSAMSTEYLGAEFDIHGGGIDLLFPHHENEQAQSRSAGDPFARYWWHNNMLGISGAKMSKSLGNFLLVPDILTRVRPQELRYYLGQPHYRALLEYSEEGLEDAANAYRRIERFVLRAADFLGPGHPVQQPAVNPAAGDLPVSFADAMDADLAVPSALASLHATVRDGNHALASGDTEEVAAHLTLVRSMLAVLGLDPLAPHWRSGDRNDRLSAIVDGLVRLALDERDKARQRKDYATADSIRETLEKIGVVVEDTAQGPRWELQR